MENTPSFAVTEGPLVTLVVPMYNVAPYLERCLRSLERQTYRNIEVIIMDDCSTDGSLDIASKMAASDMRFKVFSMPRNSGAGDARQAAIEKSSGEFVGFVDADDYVDVDFVALLYGLIIKTGADVACCQHYFYDEAHQRLTTPWAYDDKIVCLSPCEAMRKMKSYDQMDEGLWNKLCRREIVVRHRMETFPFEDAFVLYKYIPEAESVALCCVPLYYYYQRDGSLMHTDYTPYKAFARYKLEILKDPHCGAFAVIRLCSYFAAYLCLAACVQFTPRVGALWTLALVLERALSGLAVAAFPMAKNTGLAHTFASTADRTAVRNVLAVLAILLCGALLALGGGALAAVAILLFLWYHHVAVQQLGGITGDLAGWFLQKTELWMLAALCACQWGGLL